MGAVGGWRKTSCLSLLIWSQKSRYGIYATLMRAKLKTGSEDLAALEASLFSNAAGMGETLPKSQSSLSAHQELPSTAPRVKHSHRQATSSLQQKS